MKMPDEQQVPEEQHVEKGMSGWKHWGLMLLCCVPMIVIVVLILLGVWNIR